MKTKTESNYCAIENKCSGCTKIVGKVGLIGNAILAVMKLVIGFLFFSTALLADALYSILDVGISILIIVGIDISARPPDDKHEYGHGKIEFIVTMIFSVLTIVGAIALFFFALYELHEGIFGTFSKYVLMAALISALANYIFYKYSDCVANQFQSPSIRSLAMHSKADALSSILVAISLICEYQGLHNIGQFVAIIETAHILFIGLEIFKKSLDGLLDAAISPEEVTYIKKIISAMPDIKNVNYVRSRKIGQKVWLNLGIEIPGSHSVVRIDVLKASINEILGDKIKNLESVMLNITPFREEAEKSPFADQGLGEGQLIPVPESVTS